MARNTLTVYGPKTTGSWDAGTPTSFAPLSNMVLVASSGPVGTDGVVGDFAYWVDGQNFKVWGPKTSFGWESWALYEETLNVAVNSVGTTNVDPRVRPEPTATDGDIRVIAATGVLLYRSYGYWYTYNPKYGVEKTTTRTNGTVTRFFSQKQASVTLAKDAIVQGVKVSAPTSTNVLNPSNNMIRVLLYLGEYQIPIVTETGYLTVEGFCLSPSNLAQFSSCGAYIPAGTYTMKMYISVMDQYLSIPLEIYTLQQADISLSLAYLSVA